MIECLPNTQDTGFCPSHHLHVRKDGHAHRGGGVAVEGGAGGALFKTEVLMNSLNSFAENQRLERWFRG